MGTCLSLPILAQQATPGAKNAPGTPIKVQILDQISSKGAKNGQKVRGFLAENTTVEGRTLPAGTEVTATVVATAKAGQLQSAGELSLQVEKAGGKELLSDVTVVMGQEGKKDLPDSAPAPGTEAVVEANSVLTFHVVPLGLANREPLQSKAVEEANTNGAGPNSTQ